MPGTVPSSRFATIAPECLLLQWSPTTPPHSPAYSPWLIKCQYPGRSSTAPRFGTKNHKKRPLSPCVTSTQTVSGLFESLPLSVAALAFLLPLCPRGHSRDPTFGRTRNRFRPSKRHMLPIVSALLPSVNDFFSWTRRIAKSGETYLGDPCFGSLRRSTKDLRREADFCSQPICEEEKGPTLNGINISSSHLSASS